MPSLYTNNMIGFLASRPGRDETDQRERGETWEADLPLDEVHREAMRLGLIESAGRATRSDTADRGSRPFRLTEDGLQLRESALEAKRKPGEEGPLLVEYTRGAVREKAEEPSNRDGLLAVTLFGALAFITAAFLYWWHS